MNASIDRAKQKAHVDPDALAAQATQETSKALEDLSGQISVPELEDEEQIAQASTDTLLEDYLRG